mmetsp:Transcript_52541/g.153105  ORF Transcript_52541/g.153105 Transcript_52541/m.153105 type:complete len:102 (-) Transcript_52541:22-327(-)
MPMISCGHDPQSGDFGKRCRRLKKSFSVPGPFEQRLSPSRLSKMVQPLCELSSLSLPSPLPSLKSLCVFMREYVAQAMHHQQHIPLRASGLQGAGKSLRNS